MPDIAENIEEKKYSEKLVSVNLAIAIAALAIKYTNLSLEPNSDLNKIDNKFSRAVNGSIALSAALCAVGYFTKFKTESKPSTHLNSQKTYKQKLIEISGNAALNTLSFAIASVKFLIPALLPNAKSSEIDSPVTRGLNSLTAFYLTPKTISSLVNSLSKVKESLKKTKESETTQNETDQQSVTQTDFQNNTKQQSVDALNSVLFTCLLGSAVLKFATKAALPDSKNPELDIIIATSSAAITIGNFVKLAKYMSASNQQNQTPQLSV